MKALLPLFLIAIGICHADLWEPWRQDAKEDLNSSSYVLNSAAPLLFKPWEAVAASDEGIIPQTGNSPNEPAFYATYTETNKAPRVSADLGDIPITETAGCELTFHFRVARVPGRLEASHTLATFELAGPSRRDVFYLQVYRPTKASMKTGFMLNHLAKRGQWDRATVTRGAVLPAESVPLDREWHTVRIGWRLGEMEVFFDNLLALRVYDPGIDYRSFNVLKVQPGSDSLFKALDLSAIEARSVQFDRN